MRKGVSSQAVTGELPGTTSNPLPADWNQATAGMAQRVAVLKGIVHKGMPISEIEKSLGVGIPICYHGLVVGEGLRETWCMGYDYPDGRVELVCSNSLMDILTGIRTGNVPGIVSMKDVPLD